MLFKTLANINSSPRMLLMFHRVILCVSFCFVALEGSGQEFIETIKMNF